MKHLYPYFLLLLPAFCDAGTIDSLKAELSHEQRDTTRINTLNALADAYITTDTKEGQKIARNALALSQKVGFERGEARAYNLLGNLLFAQGQYDSALVCYKACAQVWEKVHNEKGKGIALGNEANVHKRQGNVDKALEKYLLCLEIFKACGDRNLLANTYMNIGSIYDNLHNQKQALENYTVALTTYKETGNKNGQGRVLANMGNLYYQRNDSKNALDYFTKAIDLYEQVDSKSGLAEGLINVGSTYITIGDSTHSISDYNKALLCLYRALPICEEVDNSHLLILCYGNLGDAFASMQQVQKSIKYYDTCYSLSVKANDQFYIQQIAGCLYDQYMKLGDYKKALAYFQIKTAYRDSMMSEQKSQQISNLLTKYETEKKEQQIVLQSVQLRQQALVTRFIIVGFVIVILASLLLLRAYRKNKVLTAQVQQKNKDITDSIQYAKRIQQALLPSEKYIDRYLSNRANK